MQNIKDDPLIKKIMNYLADKYKCHTIILYGSRARGESTQSSDYDIIAIRESGEMERDCRLFENRYLDVFIYSEEEIKNPDVSLLRIKDGVVLFQKNSIGDDLLNKVKKIHLAGPPITPDWEKQEINTWVVKMLDRSKQSDIEANFRRHWLLHDLLECYFKLNDKWYLGAKESFKWLKENDSCTYYAFDNALKPDADLNALENLIKHMGLK